MRANGSPSAHASGPSTDADATGAAQPQVVTLPGDRPQSMGEEIANAVSHGIALLLAIAALPVLVVKAAREGGAADIVAATLFTGTMIVLYGISTLYHALPAGRAKRWLNRLDHAAI